MLSASVEANGKQSNFEAEVGKGKIVIGGIDSSVDCIFPLIKNFVGARENSSNRYFMERVVVPKKPSNIEMLRNILGTSRENRLLIVIDYPQHLIARTLVEDGSVHDAISEWQSAADRLVKFADAGDPRILVVCASDAEEFPASFAAFLSERLGLFCENKIEAHKQRTRWNDFYLLIAGEIVRQNAGLYSLGVEIEQRKNFVPAHVNSLHQIDCMRAYREHREIRNENVSLFNLLHQLQLDFESKVVKAVELADKNKLLSDRIESTEAELAKAMGRLKDEEEKISALIRRLKDEEKKVATLTTDSKRLRERIVKKDAVIRRMELSKSWKMTAPFRLVMKYARGIRH